MDGPVCGELGPVSKPGEPVVDGSYVDGGLVADGEFVVPGCDGAVAFEPVDAAFHGMTGTVVAGVEGERTTAAASSLTTPDNDRRRAAHRARRRTEETPGTSGGPATA